MDQRLTSPAIELTTEQLAGLNNAELLQLIQLLETHEVGAVGREYDHRKYLERHELERIFFLLRWLRRSRNSSPELLPQVSPAGLPSSVAV